MKDYEVTAKKKIGEEEHSATVVAKFGDTVEESIQAFGAEVVNSNFIANAKITLQAAIRRYMEAGKSEAEIQDLLRDWKPGVSIQRSVDPVAAILGKFGSMDAEAQKELINQLKQRAAGKK